MSPLTGRVKLLGGLMRHAGIDVRGIGERLERRLVFQKTAYFLRAFGFSLGYGFNYYIYGPYSPSLARDGFALAEAGGELPFVLLPGPAQKQMDLFKRFIANYEGEPQKLELVASLHFLHKIYPSDSKDQLVKRIYAKKPYLKGHSADECWDKLVEFELV